MDYNRTKVHTSERIIRIEAIEERVEYGKANLTFSVYMYVSHHVNFKHYDYIPLYKKKIILRTQPTNVYCFSNLSKK